MDEGGFLMGKRYTSMERVLTTMSKHEPDKVPLFFNVYTLLRKVFRCIN